MEPPAAEPKSSFVSRFLKKTAPRFLSEVFVCVGVASEQKKMKKKWKPDQQEVKTPSVINDPLTISTSNQVVPHGVTGGSGGYSGDAIDENIQGQLKQIVSYVESQQMQGQDPEDEIPSRSNETIVLEDDIETKYNSFKQFDIIQDFSDHYFRKYKPQKPTKTWVKSIEKEWKILEEDLPGTIYVRIYEERMDIMRAAIVGPSGTPYHDGLFFFDIYFPPSYPSKPPEVHYWSRGLRLNPNLYACGKVCISLINTWSGNGCEKWIPTKSSMLQVLVSIQALVLNARPYFNEPEYDAQANTPYGEKQSLRYSSNVFISSGKTMLFSLRNPPKHFEGFVAGHFHKHGKNILVACSAYINGAPVGSIINEEGQDLMYEFSKNSCSLEFKTSMKWLLKELAKEFAANGVDCAEFLPRKDRDGEAESSGTAPK